MGKLAAFTVAGFMALSQASQADAQRGLATRAMVDPPRVPTPFRTGAAPAPPPLTSPLSANQAPGPAADDALFAAALNAQTAGSMPKARKLWFELIKNHPRSRHIPSAYMSFGDYFFSQGSMANALKFYRRVMRDFRTYQHNAYIQVKVAWAELNMGRFQNALQEFFKAWSRRPGPALTPVIQHGLIVSYAQIGKAQRAYQFFRRVNRNSALVMLERLGLLYQSQGKYRQAVFTFRALISHRPRSPKTCDWQLAVASSFISLDRKKKSVRALIDSMRLVSALQKRGTRLGSCARRVQNAAYWRASAMQREAHKTRGLSKLLRLAARLYAAYGNSFPRGPHIANVRFFHSEALWRLARLEKNTRLAKQKWRSASAAFHRAASTPGQPRPRVKEARRASRLASQNASRL